MQPFHIGLFKYAHMVNKTIPLRSYVKVTFGKKKKKNSQK